MPKIQTTTVYRTVDTAIKNGYTTISAQGSSRSGKTYNIMLFLCVYCMNKPLTTVSVVRETLTSIRRSVFRDFQENMLNLGLWDERNWKKTNFIYYFDNGSWMEFFGADNEQKLRGSKREILYVNEGNELTFIEWQQLQMRTTLFSIIDYNPSFTDDHWICQLNKEESTYHFITTYKQNPFLEEKVVKEIESLKQKNPSLWRVYGEGLQAIVEGLVFENTEIIDSIPNWVKKKGWLGMDLGYTSDPTAIAEVWFHDNTLYIDEVCYQTHMLTSDIIKAIKAHTEATGRKWKIISESADPRLIDEIYNAGIDIHAVRKYPGSILAGIQKMQEIKIKITKRSTNVRKEFKNYTYRQDKEGHWLNEPIDAFNHCFVGDTLVKTLIGDTRIDCIKEGDYILTSNGYMPVGKVFVHKREKIWKVRLDFGDNDIVVSATPNHLFKTSKGWKKLSELKAKDVLFLHNSLTERSTTFIKEKGTIHEEQNVCTLPCGNTTMAKCLKGIISTISTEILPITVLKTLLSFKGTSILKGINKKRCKKKGILKMQEPRWTMRESTLQSGMVAMKEDNGIPNTQRKLQTTQSSRTLDASIAELYIEQRISDNINSAPTNVGLQIEGTTQRKTLKKECVSNAEKHSLSTNTAKSHIAQEVALLGVQVISEDYADVYDLHVDYCHEFFANGILVHNCIDAIRYVVLEEILGGYGNGMTAAEILDMLG